MGRTFACYVANRRKFQRGCREYFSLCSTGNVLGSQVYKSLTFRSYPATLCCGCVETRLRNRSKTAYKAHQVIAREVKAGRLPPAKSRICVDCGSPASCYEHRNYLKPLEVEPVCRRCNCRRGPGYPYDGHDPRWANRAPLTINQAWA